MDRTLNKVSRISDVSETDDLSPITQEAADPILASDPSALSEKVVDLDHKRPGGIALALGGGAARGWSHIGVLRALDDSKIPVEMIAGTSIGALVGGCYLSGHLDELEEFARSLTRRRIVGFLDFSLRGSGLISGIKLAERMESHLKDVRIEDLGRTLVCVATEIRTGHEVWLSHGPIIDAIRASYALPGIFEPVAMHDRLLVDGALVNPVPVSVCRVHEASCVVAINLNSDIFGKAAVVRPKPNPEETVEETGESGAQDQSSIGKWLVGEQGKSMGMTGVMVEAFNIIQDRISRSRLAGDPPDLMFSPRVGHVGLSEFHRADETIDLGYQATMEQIDRIREAAEAGRLAHA